VLVGDLVITDVCLPGQDDVSAMIDIRRSHPTLPLIVISGGDRSELAERLEAAGLSQAVWTVPKPFLPEELLAAIAVALGA
jgi:CheY-like chemotaxis protein